MTNITKSTPLDLSNLRYWHQNARHAIRDIYDAMTELVTNADDAYARQNRPGRIEIEVERRRKEPSLVAVRDFAGGMTTADMVKKLPSLGNRYNSGLAEGANVRGTNSRGAKDVAVLGKVIFESITADGQYAKCEITRTGKFQQYESQIATRALRGDLGIKNGTGMRVTIEIDPIGSIQIPQHENLLMKLQLLVPLREILSDPEREVYLMDRGQDRRDRVVYRVPDGTERVKEQLKVPGYPSVEAKLVIKRAKRRLDNEKMKFRAGGIIIKSRRAVHEATMFAPELERDPHAAWFFGRLTCGYIDDLWNAADDQFEHELPMDPKNPCPILDPHRQTGLRREHPFTKALFQEALKRFRPLVEEERRREESQRAQIESAETRKRLNELERAATRFIEDNREEDEETNDADSRTIPGGLLAKKGFILSPPFAQIVLGQSQRFRLNVSQETYPELAEGSGVQIVCATDEISANMAVCPLELHPTHDGVLCCTFEVRSHRPTPATGVTVQVGGVVGHSVIEVLASERERYAEINDLQFNHQRYGATPGIPKRVRLFAPYPGVVTVPTIVMIGASDRQVAITGNRVLQPRDNLGIAECKLQVMLPRPDMRVTLTAEIKGHKAEAEVTSGPLPGESIKIKIEDIDLKNARSRWKGQVLEIAGRHPSIRRYLGSAPAFLGQEKAQFRVLLAEIVAFAVCERLLTRNVQANPDEYRDADLDAYLAERDGLVSRFLLTAHESQVPRPE